MPLTDSWFEIVEGDSLQQGDFFPACPSPIIPDDLPSEIQAGQEINLPFELYNAVILTQSCDLVSKNLQRVMLCPHFPLSNLTTLFNKSEWTEEAMVKLGKKVATSREELRRQHPTLPDALLDKLTDDLKRRERARELFKENLRRGGTHNVHMLNRCDLEGFAREIQLVDFKLTFNLASSYLKRRCGQGPRLRLKSPYIEHLSQAFARYFMRVGLPSDIPPFV